MKSFTTLKNLYKSNTKDTSAANETLGIQFNNDSIRTICSLNGGKLRFLESTSTIASVANQEAYEIPNKYRKLIDMYFTVGTGTSATIYMPEMVFDPTKWKLVLAYRLGTNDFPYYTYVENQKVKLQPIPATSGNDITMRGRLNVRDLSIDDYTTGSVFSISHDGTAVVGTGTTVWTEDMIGRYIRINETTAANGGDGFWYEIGGWTDANHITLTKPYNGTSITAGSAAYTIGQMSLVPEAYDVAIVYRSTALYWQQEGTPEGLNRARTYWMMYDGGMEAGYSKEYGGLMLQMLQTEGETEEGAYVPPFGGTNPTIMQAPYYFPYQQATGFN